jgi:antirestriction protein ArdC
VANSPRPDHAASISHWLSFSKADKRAIPTAASKAAQAVDYLDGLRTAEEAPDADQVEEAAARAAGRSSQISESMDDYS